MLGIFQKEMHCFFEDLKYIIVCMDCTLILQQREDRLDKAHLQIIETVLG